MNRENPLNSLRRFVRPVAQESPREVCELCSQPLAPQHRHLLETANRKVICACDGCALRFQEVIGGRFQLIPRDVVALPNFQMEDAQWEDLALPINLVFIFARGPQRSMTAAYPSPAGVTESLLTLRNWEALAAQNLELMNLKPEVEALLINRVGKTREYFIVPIDVCFALAGLIRKYWHGLSGGDQVWGEVGRFFVNLRKQAGVSAPGLNPIKVYA
jgi:hypothetical protein